jgi:ribosomal protein L29
MKDLQKKTDADLAAHLKTKREELRTLRFAASGSGMRDVKSQHNTKQEIARTLTELNQRTRTSNA